MEHDYDEIPGTYVFDGKRSAAGFPINKMCMTFNDRACRQEFANDMDAYCRKFSLNDEQREAVLSGDVLGLLRMGGNIYFLTKLANFHGWSDRDVGAIMQGITTQQFQKNLDKKADQMLPRLKQEGDYWIG